MRRYLLLLAVMAVAGGAYWLILPEDRTDHQLLERLANHHRAGQSVAEPERPNDQDTFFLTNEVQARRDTLTGHWRIGIPGQIDHVVLPYSPADNALAPPHDTDNQSPHSGESDFVGPQACKACHLKNYDGFAATSHAVTSRDVSLDSMTLATAATGTVHSSSQSPIELGMQNDDGRYVQTIKFADWTHHVPMDVVTGSGKTGQSFLFWRGQALFQNHASLLTSGTKWIASPGFREGVIDFSRRIRSACLECHATYIETAGDARRFHQGTAVWGVTCERCHGPGRQHVDFNQAHPELPSGSSQATAAIVNPRNLSRKQQLDLCGQCHSGMFELKQPAFSYRPGDDLAEFHQPFTQSASGAGGIHTSDQRLRLEMSECFKNSTMTCTTCHDPHRFERDDSSHFASICQQCHQPESCGKLEALHLSQSDDCIQCHMPISDNLDMVDAIEGEFTIKMVDHYIRIDQAASARWLDR